MAGQTNPNPTDNSHRKHNTTRYTLNVWVTTAFLSPALFIIALNIYQNQNLQDIINHSESCFIIYVILVFLEFLSSSILIIPVYLLILFIISRDLSPKITKWLIFTTGIMLTITTSFMAFASIDLSGDDMVYIAIALCNCLFMGGSIWLYPLTSASASD